MHAPVVVGLVGGLLDERQNGSKLSTHPKDSQTVMEGKEFNTSKTQSYMTK